MEAMFFIKRLPATDFCRILRLAKKKATGADSEIALHDVMNQRVQHKPLICLTHARGAQSMEEWEGMPARQRSFVQGARMHTDRMPVLHTISHSSE